MAKSLKKGRIAGENSAINHIGGIGESQPWRNR
jgi:hypothetical protein